MRGTRAKILKMYAKYVVSTMDAATLHRAGPNPKRYVYQALKNKYKRQRRQQA